MYNLKPDVQGFTFFSFNIKTVKITLLLQLIVTEFILKLTVTKRILQKIKHFTS